MKEKGKTNFFISLIFLDLTHGNLKKLHTVEYSSDWLKIYVNKADPTAFLLTYSIADRNAVSSRICKVADNTIIIGEIVETDLHPDWFYDKCVYGLNWYYENQINVSSFIYIFS
jgi:hypothetical protein